MWSAKDVYEGLINQTNTQISTLIQDQLGLACKTEMRTDGSSKRQRQKVAF